MRRIILGLVAILALVIGGLSVPLSSTPPASASDWTVAHYKFTTVDGVRLRLMDGIRYGASSGHRTSHSAFSAVQGWPNLGSGINCSYYHIATIGVNPYRAFGYDPGYRRLGCRPSGYVYPYNVPDRTYRLSARSSAECAKSRWTFWYRTNSGAIAKTYRYGPGVCLWN